MKRTNLNAWIDVAALVEFLLLLATGLLIWWRLPPGSNRTLTLWQMSRHDWGNVHFWIAMAFLATLAVHLVLHWKWITSVVAGKVEKYRRRRKILATLLFIAVTATILIPLVAPLTEVPDERGYGRHRAEAVQSVLK